MAEHTKTARKLQVQLTHDVTREQVFAAMETIFRVSGCLTCGIRGIDLNLLGGDPESQFTQLRGMPGVAGISGG